jgi:hypothetical protein
MVDRLAIRLALSANTNQVFPDARSDPLFDVFFVAKGIPFKHALGQLLYQTRCRVKLDGETLVILPPESP